MAEELAEQSTRLKDALGTVGVWSFALDRQTAERAREYASQVESLGYKTLWIPEGLGSKDVFAHSSILLGATEHLVVATGIASIYARDPYAMANGARAMADAYPGRFVLGIGVSHAPVVERRGHTYEPPVEAMRSYLDAMDAARYAGPEPEQPAPRVIAALGPKMLELAAERTDGSHTYFVPVEHTAFARSVLGDGPLLLVEQAVVLETDAERSRAVARKYMSGYIGLTNYASNLRRLGWGADELTDGGSDRLVDAIVSWGDVEAIRARVQAHLDAGADHVCLQLLSEHSRDLLDEQLKELAPALLS